VERRLCRATGTFVVVVQADDAVLAAGGQQLAARVHGERAQAARRRQHADGLPIQRIPVRQLRATCGPPAQWRAVACERSPRSVTVTSGPRFPRKAAGTAALRTTRADEHLVGMPARPASAGCWLPAPPRGFAVPIDALRLADMRAKRMQ